jgi:CheY-like chemotaxis protein/HPt (histidine-containing phosphotransfer) domain-containing protein
MNLVGNAIKFTEHGEVVVRVVAESQELGPPSTENAGGALHFMVIDTGIGIPQEKQTGIFQAFTQADGSTTRKYGGTGLGLTISRQLVEMMGGRIWLESSPGKGSTFHFSISFGLAKNSAAESEARDDSLRGVSALVVDDNRTNRSLLEKMLRSWGMKPVTAGSLAQVMAALAQQSFELILLDIRMPEIHGFELCERIRQIPGMDGSKIIMVGSAARRQDAIRCRELGVAAYLVKPLNRRELRLAIGSALAGVAQRREALPVVREEKRPGGSRRLRILLAEDNTTNQAVAVGLLTKFGHAVVIANDGNEALSAFDRQAFDLVFMDVQMPAMDGFEATAAIRARELKTGSHIPIIAMTAHTMKGDREKCLAAGMDSYLSKPIDGRALLQAIDGAVLPIVPKELSSKPSSANPAPLVNREELMRRLDGNTDLMRIVVSSFLADAPRSLGDIHSALESNNAEDLYRLAHRLKGALSNFSSEDVNQAVLRLETIAKERDLSYAGEAYRDLAGMIERLTPELTRLAAL